jgi:hypothetical protein
VLRAAPFHERRAAFLLSLTRASRKEFKILLAQELGWELLPNICSGMGFFAAQFFLGDQVERARSKRNVEHYVYTCV